jgi:hypothetical protein
MRAQQPPFMNYDMRREWRQCQREREVDLYNFRVQAFFWLTVASLFWLGCIL